ncbi:MULTISPECIES: GbsR/MarR family transcriptional regulator [unclassified Amycolatopsis]|uniref:GbsR/MarR family transcriptional regulator n=1 Tax=Amycolatopsis TaxID=1813 RepID=UPI0002625D53|nr:transcriptional regulator [Amycolatopsis sp. ATCC 39116]
MTPEQQDFVNALGDTLATWNLPRATGRIYGYLLLRGEASTSDELRAALSLSSGAVSTATRELVSWGLARTIPQPGSRRLLVEAAGGFEQLLAASHERARAFIRTLRAAEELTETERAAGRLRDVRDLFTSYIDAGERVLRERAADGNTRIQA